MAGDSYSSCIGTSRTNGIRSISKKDLYMIPTILSVAAKRDRICPALHGLYLFLFQGIQQAGRFCFFWLHGYREGRVLITESAYFKRARRKRFHTVVRDRQDFRHHGIICNPDSAADQGRAGLKLLSPETDAHLCPPDVPHGAGRLPQPQKHPEK